MDQELVAGHKSAPAPGLGFLGKRMKVYDSDAAALAVHIPRWR